MNSLTNIPQSVIPSCGCTNGSAALFLNRPYAGAKVYPCTEEHFWKSIHCSRVQRLDQMRKGILPHNDEEREGLKLNQPTFNLTNRYLPEGGTEWNGRFLFSFHDVKFARKVMETHAVELGVILAFAEPDYDRYWFLIDTHPADFSDESAKTARIQILAELHRYFPRVTPYSQWFFVRAVPEEYIDILDEEALFYGRVTDTDEDDDISWVDEEDSDPTPPTAPQARACRTMSLGEILESVFGGIFRPRLASPSNPQPKLAVTTIR